MYSRDLHRECVREAEQDQGSNEIMVIVRIALLQASWVVLGYIYIYIVRHINYIHNIRIGSVVFKTYLEKGCVFSGSVCARGRLARDIATGFGTGGSLRVLGCA